MQHSCAVIFEAKQKVLSNVVDTLSDILEIDSEDKVQLSVSADSDLGTIYSITVPVRRLKPEYHDEEDLEALTNIQNLKLPSHRPSIVCENCLYSQEKDRRARAFHIMDPKGILEMLLMFLDGKGNGVLFHPSHESNSDSTNRILPFLGRWKGHSRTKRSGVYAAKIAEVDTVG
ncbi:hypothetical protein Peur_064066 [Populus x canadensis]